MFFKSLFKSLGEIAKSSGIGGLINKAKDFVGSGLKAITSRPIKGIVDSVSHFLPSVGNAYNSIKKYGHMANNFLNGGLETKGERAIKASPLLSQVDRIGRVEPPAQWHHRSKYENNEGRSRVRHRDDEEKHSIERAPRQINKEEDDIYGGLFS